MEKKKEKKKAIQFIFLSKDWTVCDVNSSLSPEWFNIFYCIFGMFNAYYINVYFLWARSGRAHLFWWQFFYFCPSLDGLCLFYCFACPKSKKKKKNLVSVSLLLRYRGCLLFYSIKFYGFRCFPKQREIHCQIHLPVKTSSIHGNASLISEVKMRALPRSWRPLNFPNKMARRWVVKRLALNYLSTVFSLVSCHSIVISLYLQLYKLK